MNEIEVTVSRYNATAMIGWAGITIGLIGAALQYFAPSMTGFAFLVVGLIGGCITVNFAGPWRTVEVRKLHAKKL